MQGLCAASQGMTQMALVYTTRVFLVLVVSVVQQLNRLQEVSARTQEARSF